MITEFRISLTVQDYEKMVAFYKDSLGLSTVLEWNNPDERGIILDVGRATLELVDPAQAETIDRIEAEQRLSGQIRFALEVADLSAAASALVAHGAAVVHEPVKTPWGDHNQRLQAPDGMQITLYVTPAGN